MLLSCFIILNGCVPIDTNRKQVVLPPSAEEELSYDPDVDIFMLNNVIYKTDIDWVNELELTIDEQVAMISSNYDKESSKEFSNEMATSIPIGSKIYSTIEREDILIVDINGAYKKYYVLSEG